MIGKGGFDLVPRFLRLKGEALDSPHGTDGPGPLAFDLGDSDKTIGTIDADGAALAAILGSRIRPFRKRIRRSRPSRGRRTSGRRRRAAIASATWCHAETDFRPIFAGRREKKKPASH